MLPIRAAACLMSLSFPGDNIILTTLPKASVDAWIFVVRPPLDFPTASASLPPPQPC
jgi:hypothetical protein